jgi:hypothetical protein
MQAVFTSFNADKLTGMIDKFNITTYKNSTVTEKGKRLLEESGEK